KGFEAQYAVPLEPIYTGKMMFGLSDLIKNNYFSEGTRILAIHSGGLQADIRNKTDQ
ncbi:1-aminocyclopropane-1-carboxylate deaminase/D-cysteine desulfhydrase, partial [Acinetobacter baumannii]